MDFEGTVRVSGRGVAPNLIIPLNHPYKWRIFASWDREWSYGTRGVGEVFNLSNFLFKLDSYEFNYDIRGQYLFIEKMSTED